MEWISVKERLPDIYYPELILVAVKGPNYVSVMLAGYFTDDSDNEWKAHFEIQDSDYMCLPAEVTHWMPLPPPPKGDI